MSALATIIVGVVEAAAIGGVLFALARGKSGASAEAQAKLQQELSSRSALIERISTLLAGMIPIPRLREQAVELKSFEESLKAERGRITITQAELETVENRLRELEEISRELEASGLETKEEMNILAKKQAELTQKNNDLKERIEVSRQKLEQLFAEVEMSTQLREQIQGMHTSVINTEQRIEELMLSVHEGNEQYFILKKRYDALDIEYAQLYEKFSEAESAKAEPKKAR